MRGGCIQVLEISAGELGVRDDLDLSITNLGDLDDITEVSDTAVNLDLVLKELLECGNVEDLVAGGLRSIDNELFALSTILPVEKTLPIQERDRI